MGHSAGWPPNLSTLRGERRRVAGTGVGGSTGGRGLASLRVPRPGTQGASEQTSLPHSQALQKPLAKKWLGQSLGESKCWQLKAEAGEGVHGGAQPWEGSRERNQTSRHSSGTSHHPQPLRSLSPLPGQPPNSPAPWPDAADLHCLPDLRWGPGHTSGHPGHAKTSGPSSYSLLNIWSTWTSRRSTHQPASSPLALRPQL